MRTLPPVVDAAFRFALRLLPRKERDAVARRVLDGVEEGWRERREREGRARALAFAAREMVDLLWNVLAARVPWAALRRKRDGTGGVVGIETVAFSLRVAIRGLVRSPALVIGAVVTLGVGIGVNLALFSVLHAVLLSPLPYGDPDDLVAVYTDWEGSRELGLDWSEVVRLHEDARTLESVTGTLIPGMDSRFVIETPDGLEAVEAVRVAPNFFQVLQVAPALGPGVQADGPIDEIEPAVLLPDATWRRRFGADPSVLGTSVRITGTAFRIAGILPPDFSFQLGSRPPEFYLVHTPGEAELRDRGNPIVQPIARLRPGAGLADARADLARMAPEMIALRPADGIHSEPDLRPLHDHMRGDLSGPLVALGSAALLVLVVACANLAALFLARHTEREGEQAVRAALGAGRGQLARLPLAEALLLGLGGGIVGLAFAAGASHLVLSRVVDPLAGYQGFQVGPTVGLAAVALAVVSGFLFGGLPAWRSSRTRPAAVLQRSSSRGASGSTRATRALAAAEASALLVLLVATGLSLRSLQALLDVDLGFQTEGRAAATLIFPQGRYGVQEFGDLVNRIETRLEALPGVRAAGTVTHLPLDANNWGGILAVEGEDAEGSEPLEWELASPGYFEAAGIDLLRGRSFSPDDDPNTPMVTVISRALARHIRGDGSLDEVLGMRISGTGPEGPWMEVVGVVADVRQDRVGGQPRPHMYVSHAQFFPFPERELVVATDRADPLTALREAEAALAEIDPEIVVSGPRTLDMLLNRALGRPRIVTSLLGLFGAASLLLALTGIYGITAFATARRRRELGIRACLGAGRTDLFGRALSEALVPVAAGCALGLVVVVAAAPRARGLLYGVEPLDLPTLLAVPLLMLATAAATAWLPALRASHADPAEVLDEG